MALYFYSTTRSSCIYDQLDPGTQEKRCKPFKQPAGTKTSRKARVSQNCHKKKAKEKFSWLTD
jgi:hypothetical protein